MIERLCVIGVGLIGGSLARDLRRLGLVGEVVGCSRSATHLERAVELGIVDRYDTDVGRAVDGADMVVLAVPLGAMQGAFSAMSESLGPKAVVTDVGSSKRSVVDAAARAFGGTPSFFVPAHPIAGTEHSGVEAALDGLFERRRVIVTPTPSTGPGALARVRAMWGAVGADVIEMEVDHHDDVLAATSHVPHLLAYTLVDVLGSLEERAEIFKYAAGGFRDFTRIASSDPQMWHDICLANRSAIVTALSRFGEELSDVVAAIERGDGDRLKTMFARAKALRDRYVEMES